jgi:glycosyltransferase involved in cell wall biosynthesis
MRKPLVTAIVTTRNNQTTLEACLQSIVNQTYDHLEIVLVDNYSTDDTLKLASKFTPYIFQKGPERSVQRNFGVERAHGSCVVIIDSDMELSPEVIAECVQAVQQNANTSAVIIPEESFGRGIWAKAKKLERSFYLGVPWIEAARFYEKALYQRLGGFNEQLVSGEDWDLSQRAAKESSIGRITSFIYHNEGKLKLSVDLKKKLYYAKQFRRYAAANKDTTSLNTQISVVSRYSIFFKQPAKLLEHPFIGASMLYMKTSEFAVGAYGFYVSRKQKPVQQITVAPKPPSKTVKLAFFSFGILEQGGGCEDELIDTASKITTFAPNISVTAVTSTPKLTKRLQYLLSAYYFRKPSADSIYREPSDHVRKRLGEASYVQFNTLSELSRIINNSEVIYTKNEILELFILKLIARKIKKPLVVKIATAIHYPYTVSRADKLHNFLYGSQFYKWLLRDAAAIRVNNVDDRNYLKEHFGLTNVFLGHNAFEVQQGRQIQNNDQTLRVLFVGRMTTQKGTDILLQIISLLKQRGNLKSFEFKIAGSGEEEVEQRVKYQSVTHDNIEYLGHVHAKEMRSLYDWSDVTIIPSYYETLNRVAAETAAAGKIAICTDIPGPREIVHDNKTGYLLPLNATAFVNKLEEVLEMKNQNPTSFYAMGNQAQRKILQEFSPTSVYSTLSNLFLLISEGSRIG